MDVAAFRFTPSVRTYYDLNTYADFCAQADIFTSGAELIFTMRIDMLDCDFGAFGGINQILNFFDSGLPSQYGEFQYCEWKNY